MNANIFRGLSPKEQHSRLFLGLGKPSILSLRDIALSRDYGIDRFPGPRCGSMVLSMMS